jgi:hypothetical protein
MIRHYFLVTFCQLLNKIKPTFRRFSAHVFLQVHSRKCAMWFTTGHLFYCKLSMFVEDGLSGDFTSHIEIMTNRFPGP